MCPASRGIHPCTDEPDGTSVAPMLDNAGLVETDESSLAIHRQECLTRRGEQEPKSHGDGRISSQEIWSVVPNGTRAFRLVIRSRR
jgi:hypothetical protein